MTDANNQINDVLSKLTALGTVIVPLNVITGLWGMNVNVPGQGVMNLHWFFGIVSVMIALAGESIVCEPTTSTDRRCHLPGPSLRLLCHDSLPESMSACRALLAARPSFPCMRRLSYIYDYQKHTCNTAADCYSSSLRLATSALYL